MKVMKAGVCGAGTMGSGIAQTIAQHGFSVWLYDVNEHMLEQSKKNIEANLLALVTKNKITEAERKQALQNIHFTSSIQACKAEIIIEAIIEEANAKVNLLQQLEPINAAYTVFASNTSSLSITQLAQAMARPQRFAGMHFFNPAPVMKLVEVVKGEHTSNNTIDKLRTFANALNKTTIVCKDVPGFVVNRVARPFYLEALYIAEQYNINIASIDAAVEACDFKMGPFRLMDLIGIDINYAVSNSIWQALHQPERLKPSALQQKKLQEGALGRKTKKGFYSY
jgi:3-hydroxybutyryl-CoA dehydrogenase